MKHPRRKKLIKPGLQMRLVVVFGCVACAMVLVQAIMLNHTLMNVFRRLPNDGPLILEEWPGILTGSVLVTFALVVPITLGIGILATFKIAGPLYRFEQHFKELIAGRDPGPCRLRKDDELLDLADLITRGIEAVRADQNQTVVDEPDQAEPERRVA
jgi:hypothetical protein